MIAKNKEVIQSYILTTAKYDFSIYEKRILYRLVELAQKDLKNKKLDKNYTISKTLFDDRIITMPVSGFLGNGKDNNYSRVKAALDKLESKVIYYEDERTWEKLRIIQKPKVDKYGSIAEFEVQPKIWQAILNFAKGFKKFELKTAMSFESTYAMRFYELFSEQKTPITYTIDNLKVMFSIENKYKNRPADFIRFVVLSAKKELDKKSPWSFDYELVKLGRKINSITFHPYFIPENKDLELEKQNLQKQVSLSWDFNKDVRHYLKNFYGFDTQGIKHNIELFKAADKTFDLLLFLAELRQNAEKAPNRAGYLINALRKKLGIME